MGYEAAARSQAGDTPDGAGEGASAAEAGGMGAKPECPGPIEQGILADLAALLAKKELNHGQD